MISCEEATTICNKKQYKEASFMERLHLAMHLFVCKACSGFSRKNKQLTALCQRAALKSLSEERKETMRQVLNKER